ncbi:trissin receptor-like [Patella vulgata]|uniref:trissin receptor-like n=1 Tax=Patella vulgata TaxID=6465 RepID=UPI0024A9300C|nr:trissin receptor-like [Patella vulgata]
MRGNALVLFIILKNARMRTRPYVFLANLAVADLSVGVFCVIPSLTTFLSPVWILGENMSYMTSILLLTVISVERFVATMFPLRANNLFTPWYVAPLIIMGFMYSKISLVLWYTIL